MYQYVYATLTRCIGSGCKSSTLIDAMIPNIIVSVVILNSYLDVEFNIILTNYLSNNA